MSVETAIWNRACSTRDAPDYPGDIALSKAISFHGVACNGGVAHSLEFHAREMDSVLDAFRTLGAPEMCDLLTSIAQEYEAASQRERALSERFRDGRYHAAMSDRRLFELFTALLKASPSSFAPLE